MGLIVQIKRLIRSTFLFFGIEIKFYNKTGLFPYDVRARRLRLIKDNKITLIVDVGANSGQYAKALRKSGYSGEILSIEPLSQAFIELSKNSAKDNNWECLNLALGEKPGIIEINVAGNSVSSSILKMNQNHVDALPESAYTRTELVDIKPLDNVLKELKDSETIYLKIDVQGYEFQVLAGAIRTLSNTAIIEMELSLVPLYGEQLLLCQMIDYMNSIGFKLISIEPGFTNLETGYVLQVDGIFIKEKSM